MYSFLLFILFSLILLGLIIYKSWLNPISIFNLIWFLVIALYSLRLSPALQLPLDDRTCELLLWSSLLFSISCFLVTKISIREKKNVCLDKEITFNRINTHFFIWFILELFETAYSRGLPIIWALRHSGKTYFDYGIPSLHGLANAYGLSILTILAYQLFSGKNKKKAKQIIIYIGIILGMYVLMLTRQVIISAILQLFIVYCFVKRKFPIFKIIIGALIGILIFGILGNIRTGYNEFLTIAQIHTNLPPALVGFYWVYMYLTMTLANLNKIFTLAFNPVGIGYFLSIYLPTVIVNLFFKVDSINPANYIVTPAFNVSGYNADAYISLGITGLILMALIYGILGGITYKKVINERNMKNIIYYAIYFQIMILSFFYNQLFYLPSGFQFIIIFIIFKNTKIRGEQYGRK